MVPLRSGTLAESPFQIVRPKRVVNGRALLFFLLELASCLGTKRGLMQWDNSRVCAITSVTPQEYLPISSERIVCGLICKRVCLMAFG
jgi:hypothetical protein